MRRFVQISYFLVDAIHRERILNQVVRSDAEEIDFRGQNITGHGGDGISIMTPTSMSSSK